MKLQEQPYVIYGKQDSTDAIKLYGFLPELWESFQTLTNFTYSLQTPPDGKFGGLSENGTWNGVIGEIVNGRAYCGLAAFLMNEERSNVVDVIVFEEDS